MAGRLVKIAKELNVGTATIVEFLSQNGFEVENKPTSKVSDEMHNALLKEFSNSMAVKEKADQIVIGDQRKVEKPEPVVAKKPPAPVAPPPPPPAPKAASAPEPPKVEVKAEETKEATDEVVKAKSVKVTGPKIIGKIDLNRDKKPVKKAVKPKQVEKPKPKPVVKQVKEVKKDDPKRHEGQAKKAPPAPPEMVKRVTPKLQGLKVLGKIDKSKLDKINKKPEKAEKPKRTAAKPGESRRRVRTRKKVSAQNYPKGRQGSGAGSRGGRPNPNQPKEVSKKEIEDKIKATMARLSGGGKKKRQKIRRDNREDKRKVEEIKKEENRETTLKVTEFISVSELANLLNVSISEVITTCMNLGVIVSINQRLDAEIIELVAGEFGTEVAFITAEDETEEEEEIIDDPADLTPRAPIVTVMGHVDHGKTSLLDFIRNETVADGEAGGITQHIGAYEVVVGESKKKITFLDTPGHEAFTAMRARGAKVTDVAIIIIAADDKIMPQTKEAISHAQAAGVPMIFAINKIDKDGASPERIKQELSTMNLLIEEWGGTFQSQEISAKAGTNIDLLLEKIILEAEVLELKANAKRKAMGTILEASLDKGKGYVTNVLVQNGTLKIGDPVVAGSHSGKIKAMFNEHGKRIKEAGPATPVSILGLSGAPQAGETFKEMDSEQEARQLATKRNQIGREQSNRASKRISLDEIGRRLALGTFKELNLIVKGDVDGSIEALSDSLIKQSIDSVQVNVIHKAVGPIAESDILLASASDAIVIGFQVRPSSIARQLADKEGVQIKTYSIIYEAIDEIRMAIEGMLEPTQEEKIQGMVEVRETYKISKIGTIAGAFVQDGFITRKSLIRIIRNGIVVYPNKEGKTGEISSLKRFKEDAKEVKKGLECGITIKNFNDIREGDMIEAYEIIEVQQTLD